MDNDITVTKNTEGSKVTWTYTGSKPIFRDVPEGNTHHFEHTIAPKALISDIDLDHQIVWSVSNPSGHRIGQPVGDERFEQRQYICFATQAQVCAQQHPYMAIV